MPAPGQMAPHRDNAHFAKMLEALNDKSEPNLAHEVAELRPPPIMDCACTD